MAPAHHRWFNPSARRLFCRVQFNSTCNGSFRKREVRDDNLTKGALAMKNKSMLTVAVVTLSLGIVGVTAISAQGEDTYALNVPGGLAYPEVRAYESSPT